MFHTHQKGILMINFNKRLLITTILLAYSSTSNAIDNTALFNAIRDGYTGLASTLIGSVSYFDKASYLARRDNEGRNPLHLAAKYGRTATAQELIDAVSYFDRASYVQTTDNRLKTPLHDAAKNGSTEIAKLLLQQVSYFDRNTYVHAKDSDGYSALEYAAKGNHLVLAQELRNASGVGVTTSTDNKALLDAIRNDNFTLAKTLISSISIWNRDQYLTNTDAHGRTAIHLAAKYGRFTIAQEILQNVGFYQREQFVMKVDNRGHTALHDAARYGQKNIVQELMNQVSLINKSTFVNMLNHEGKTAALMALNHDIVAELAPYTPGNVTIAIDNTPLFNAIRKKGYESLAIQLIQQMPAHYREQYLFAVDKQLRTPLHLAAKYNCLSVAREIIKQISYVNRKTYLNMQDDRFQTAWFYANKNGHATLAQEIMNHTYS